MILRKILPVIFVLVFIWGCERPTDIAVRDNIPPATPSGLRVTEAHDGGVFIEWNDNNEPDLKFYNVYRSINKTAFQLVSSNSNPYYYEDSLNYNDIYSYRVSAVDNLNLESAPGDSVSAQPKNLFPPSIPARFSFNVQGRNWERKSIELSWEANTDPDISHYEIYRDTLEGFKADTSNFIGTSSEPFYSDTVNLKLYTRYYYRLKAIDNGGLGSSESHQESDMILGIPELIYPVNNSRINFFSEFLIKEVNVPSRYRIAVQSNMYFGEIWSKEFDAAGNDTIRIAFDPSYIDVNTVYYWRVAVYSNGKTEPNSISEQYQFVIKP